MLMWVEGRNLSIRIQLEKENKRLFNYKKQTKNRERGTENLLYGGSFRRFIQVAAVGNRSRAPSDALPPALWKEAEKVNKYKR